MPYLKKEVDDEVYFWYEHRRLLQVHSTTFGVRSQGCPKYPKQQVCISLQYLNENVKDEVDFLPTDKHQRFLQIDTIILDRCGQACPNYPK